MENAIAIFGRIRSVLGTLQITSSRSNLDTLLGCMQLCDRGIDELNQELQAQREHQEQSENLPDEAKEENADG